MVKIKVTAEVVNRWGKRYIAKDWIIEVSETDVVNFDGFARVEKVVTKKTKNENNKKRD